MEGKKGAGLLQNMFSYNGYAAKCVLDVYNPDPSEPPKTTVKIVADSNRPLLFSYAPREGLFLSGSAGKKIEGNILGKLLSIPDNDVNKHIDFLETYGFFFPASADEYTAISGDDLCAIVNRTKATIRLMSAIAKRDYRSILICTSFLLFSPQITAGSETLSFSSCKHRFTQLLESYNNFPDYSQEPEAIVKGTITVHDSMRSSYVLEYDFYQAIRSGTDKTIIGSNSRWYKNLTAMYVGCQEENDNVRSVIDFFFHFQTEVSVFKEVELRKLIPFKRFDENAITDEFQKALLRVARIVLAEEINYNIAGIHPKYESSSLSASWQVDTLLEALYFSIFYMKAGVEIYKECENPTCKRDKFFLVEATRGNKKYCCPQCANAAAAQRYRNRKMSK